MAKFEVTATRWGRFQADASAIIEADTPQEAKEKFEELEDEAELAWSFYNDYEDSDIEVGLIKEEEA